MVGDSADFTHIQLHDIQADQRRFEHNLLYKINELLVPSVDWDPRKFCEVSEIDEYWEKAYLQLQLYERELMFLKMMMWFFATWDDSVDAELIRDDTFENLTGAFGAEDIWDDTIENLTAAFDAEDVGDDTIENLTAAFDAEDIWDDTIENLTDMSAAVDATRECLAELISASVSKIALPAKQDWDFFISSLEGAIQQCKPLMLDYCHVFLDSSFQCNPLPSDKTLVFIEAVLHNLEVLVRYKPDTISSAKIQFDSLKLRLNLSWNFFQLLRAHAGVNCEELRDLEVCFHSFVNNAARLACLVWAKPENDEITLEPKIDQLLIDMREKIIRPCGSDGTLLYLGALKEFKLQPSDGAILHGELVAGLIDLHLDSLVAASKEWQFVRDGLIFLLAFMANPPEHCDQGEPLNWACNQIDILFNKCTYLIHSTQENFTMDNMLSSDLAENLEKTMRKVKQLYVQTPDLLSYDFPTTNGLGFYEFLLQNLETWNEKLNTDVTFIPFARNFIVKIEELVALRPLVIGIFELQKEQKDFEDNWLEVINLAYRTEHAIISSSSVIRPIWYSMACLLDILDQIDDLKTKLEKVDVKGDLENMQYTENLLGSLQPSSTPHERTWLSIASEEEPIVLEEETRKITDELIGGYESLGIISIIGMGGLGKTTLAKKICHSNTVRCHFHKISFATVSQVLNRRKFFIDILYGISKSKKEEIDSMSDDDLAHHIWRCLSGQIYLIVVDDIWDAKAWDAVKSSFPDDKNKSRVIFTTRELKVAMDAKSSFHHLRPRSDDESLQLLHMKVFGKEDCPPSISGYENFIAKSCKGLPLAIVVVAGLLARNKTSSSGWDEIAGASSQFIGKECKDIIEYSYKHLPEHLKSCFLYMVIYGDNELIRGKELRKLWIGEGFVNKSTPNSLRIMGKEYLRDLVDRNLVTAVSRSRGGGIRTCRLHDVIRDFCRRKVEDDNFIWLGDGYGTSNSSHSTIHNLYRVSIQGYLDDVEPAIVENIHSLLCRGTRSQRKSVLEQLKLVQVLHLESNSGSIFSIYLVHLRYLSVWCWNGEVPESICNLWNLETFIIEESNSVLELPKTIWKMKRLRHLEFAGGCKFVMEGDDHEGCLEFLDNIQFLSVLWLFDDKSARAVLRRLPNIQKLSCVLSGSKWNNEDLTIDFLDKLESFRLRSIDTVDCIHGVKFPSSLKRVDFEVENSLTRDTLSSAGELPCLEVLKLNGNLKQWDVDDGQFQKLKCLKVGLYDLEEWNASFDSFPCLEQLKFSGCKNLEEIPTCFEELPTLLRIQVLWCNKELESSVILLQQEQTDNGNEVQLEIK